MKNEVVEAKAYGIEKEDEKRMTSNLETILAEREILKDAYLDVIELDVSQENLHIFKSLRLKVRTNRTSIEKWRVAQKDVFLKGGRFVDSKAKAEIIVNSDWEEKLYDAEMHFEKIEIERIKALQLERQERLSVYVEDADQRDLAKFADDEFEAIFQMNKKSFENKIESEKKAEDLRIETERKEQEEREKIAKENAKLKSEAEAREKQIEKERLEREKLAKIESDRLANIEAERVSKENEAKKIQAKKERERISKAKIEAEAEKAKIEYELNKGDAEKVNDLIKDLQELKEKYTFESAKNKKMYSDVGGLIDKVTNFINK